MTAAGAPDRRALVAELARLDQRVAALRDAAAAARRRVRAGRRLAVEDELAADLLQYWIAKLRETCRAINRARVLEELVAGGGRS